LRQLGLTYQFPLIHSSIEEGTIYLASNNSVFQNKYGMTPFGQFTRNLSNKSQKIVLADAYGNTIDSVEVLTLTHGQHQLMEVAPTLT
jgi:hypothetical protein